MSDTKIPQITAVSEEAARQRVSEDLAGLEFRTPIVDDYNPELAHLKPGETPADLMRRGDAYEDQLRRRDSRIDARWMAVTEAARRAIISDPESRRVASSLSALPLSETLPLEAISGLSETDERVARLVERTKGSLGAILMLEPVPVELLKPDIRSAPGLQDRDYKEDYLVREILNYPDYPDMYSDSLASTWNIVQKSPGISRAEKNLVARRYRYARDVKLLGLMAELQDNPIEVDRDETADVITHQLPSGVTMTITTEAAHETPDLLNPARWESRKQLKDRVYKVTIDGKTYLLKERKTPLHTDTKRHGHIDGLTSRQEFEAASEFADLGVVRKGDVQARWEKPLGLVEFPDGYQFCLFEFEPGLAKGEPGGIIEVILAAPEEYREEFEEVKRRAREIYETRKDLIWVERLTEPSVPSRRERLLSRKTRRQNKEVQAAIAEWRTRDPGELTYEEFAIIKAKHLTDEAIELFDDAMATLGYVNSDMDGFGFKATKNGNRAGVEIIGFDFEYYKKSPETASGIRQNRHKNNEKGSRAKLHVYKYDRLRGITTAASYAMLEQMGFKLPAQRD